MKIVVDEKHGYVHLSGNVFLCLGEKRTVLRADPLTLAKMVKEALAMSAYNDIKEGKGQVIH